MVDKYNNLQTLTSTPGGFLCNYTEDGCTFLRLQNYFLFRNFGPWVSIDFTQHRHATELWTDVKC